VATLFEDDEEDLSDVATENLPGHFNVAIGGDGDWGRRGEFC